MVNGSGLYSGSIPLQYRLDMLEPVMQGYARKGETKFILTLDIAPQYDEAGCDSDVEGFEIDEDFLAPVMLSSSSQAIMSPTNENKPVAFECQALAESKSDLYEDCTLYLRTTDLGRVGGLNGDWVSFLTLGLPVHLEQINYQVVVHSNGSSNRRLIRVIADDVLVMSKWATFLTSDSTLTDSQAAQFKVLLYSCITYVQRPHRSLRGPSLFNPVPLALASRRFPLPGRSPSHEWPLPFPWTELTSLPFCDH
jgi:hypothetical protein